MALVEQWIEQASATLGTPATAPHPTLGRVSYMRNQTRIAASTTPARYVTASLS